MRYDQTTLRHRYAYLADRVRDAPLLSYPFPHLEIQHFLRNEDLKTLLKCDAVHFPPVKNTPALLLELRMRHYKAVAFPGCTMNVDDFLRGVRSMPPDATTAGYGMTFRRTPGVGSLVDYLNGLEFHAALRSRFGIQNETKIGTYVQKNLSGYEISPHPDVRRKAVTYLLNINPPRLAGRQDLGTHLLRFKPEYDDARAFWREHERRERCWVPWDWCETVKMIAENNSLLAFAPADDTLHAVKLDYDHCAAQRTQLYGSLVYTNRPWTLPAAEWPELEAWIKDEAVD